MTSSTEVFQYGWLTKSPPAKGLFRPRWRRRWFILRAGTYPNQYVLEYFTDESRRRLKGQINLDECEQVDLSLNSQLAAPLVVPDRHKYTFNLRTPSRIYYFAADSEIEMNKWVNCLCQVCGLKSVEEDRNEGAMYTKPVDENNQLPTRDHNDNRESDESSPSVSEHLSGPYISISDCFTGKPIPYDDKMGFSSYPNTSFPFPPQVNWATHPTKRDGDVVETVNPKERVVATAPPRPPKKTTSETTGTNSPLIVESTKSLHQPASNRSCFQYDNEEAHESSSTCSSLHSPPGSAGVLYSNIADLSPGYRNPSSSGNPVSQSQVNLVTTATDSVGASVFMPPKVDRHLKPDLRKPVESPSYKSHTHQPINSSYPSKHSSGAMTLPSKSSQRQVTSGPKPDRSWKPHNSTITLGPTPVQIKTQSNNFERIATTTLPTSPRRRIGPIVSPHGKKSSVFHDVESEVTYTQIDPKTIKMMEGDARPVAPRIAHKRSQSASLSEESGSVEYKLIDQVKTQALKDTQRDREEQLRTNHVSKNLK